ncbi:hypothetical protein Maq22A_c28355 [Methylobacterium aquaticum]|uniref:Uncharacterized protein n=1 Tax=Methylobacterium aquaticum TaxID=270351 RepID=A0A1Y0ZCE6_9HYPH|nr:hypothetical protein Maq22A_c28355 [Methylobacterium aquaticum]
MLKTTGGFCSREMDSADCATRGGSRRRRFGGHLLYGEARPPAPRAEAAGARSTNRAHRATIFDLIPILIPRRWSIRDRLTSKKGCRDRETSGALLRGQFICDELTPQDEVEVRRSSPIRAERA